VVELGLSNSTRSDSLGCMTPDEQLTALRDPLAWVSRFWPKMVLAPHQVEILQSVAATPETFCHSGNSLGKTRSAALAALWFFCTRFPARVIVSSSSNKQLKNALWPEVAKLIRRAAEPLGLLVTHMEVRVTDPQTRRPYDDHYMRFFTTDDVENFQGIHEDTDIPRVFVIFEEASAIADEFYDAAASFADRILVISNPLTTNNFLYQYCVKGDVDDPENPGEKFRRVIHIDADNTPNIIGGREWKALGHKGEPPTLIPGMLTWRQYRHRIATRDPLWVLQRIHGQFDRSGTSLMFPPEWLDLCEEMWPLAKDLPRGPFGLGVDVAEGGRDYSCWALVDRWGLFWIEVMDTPDTSVIVPHTLKVMQKHNVRSQSVLFDRGSGGKQYADLLRARGYPVRAISFGGGAHDKQTYKNCRAEMYWRLRQAIDQSRWSKVTTPEGRDKWERFFAIAPGQHLLREELAVLPIDNDGEGRMKIMPKGPAPKGSKAPTIKGALGRSPDRSDAVALACYARFGPGPRPSRKYAGSVVARPQAAREVEQAGLPVAERERRDEWRRRIRKRIFGQ